MQISVSIQDERDISIRAPIQILVEHNKRILEFSGRPFMKEALVPPEGFSVFEPINLYWATLPEIEQSKIFEIYEHIAIGFEETRSSKDLEDHLSNMVTLLVKHHPLEVLEKWISAHPYFTVPPEVMSEFIQDPEQKNTREKTYLRHEYIQLTAFALFSRVLLPIFGEFIVSTRKSVGVSKKEFGAVSLLKQSGILESPAVTKLMSHIGQFSKERTKSIERVMAGDSSLDSDFYLLALVTVRKLCTADLRGTEPKSSLVSCVYNFVLQKVVNPTKTEMPYQEKIFNGNDSEAGNAKRSRLEAYRKRMEFSLGETSTLELGHENVYGTARRLAPGISLDSVDSSILTAQNIEAESIGDAQVLIAAWMMKTVHAPQGNYYISPSHIKNTLGVAEAVLWHWGFHYLAILVSSHMVLSHESMHISPIDSRGQIPSDLQEKIFQHYPHRWRSVRKNTRQAVDEPHPVLHAIDLVVDDLVGNAWRTTASENMIMSVLGEYRRKLPILPTIKTELAKLVVYIEENRP